MSILEPTIACESLVVRVAHLHAPEFDLVMQVNRLSASSVMLFVSPALVDNSSIMLDTSVAMPNRFASSSAPTYSTAISKSTTSSLSLAARLAKRYEQQILVSLDLDQLPQIVGTGISIDTLMLSIERALVLKLDTILERRKKN
ncbi:proteasome assembly chaperone 4 family protein [Sporobolomyces koalae]|uniref:proteasome assembly chaperone 4 family protein n=1 Tax=Sporobolomyces koalae TaxID=500713 RepID=UPI00316B752A